MCLLTNNKKDIYLYNMKTIILNSYYITKIQSNKLQFSSKNLWFTM
jgi:hypothetical protein